ncbi:MAG TPA: hypothetical protein VK127_02055 [Nitrososphaerales archaeon]|nr:hypothetical protein [Nitrososphaerales archaeon]
MVRRATPTPEPSGKDRRGLGVSNASALNKLYWTRISLGVIAAFAAEGVFRILGGDYTDGLLVGILVYLASYYLARYTWFRNVEREKVSKVYSTGIGGYVMLFLFVWILLFTLGV